MISNIMRIPNLVIGYGNGYKIKIVNFKLIFINNFYK